MANTFARARSVTVENANATLLGAATVGRGPIADISADGDTLVVTTYGDHNVVMLNARNLAVTGVVPAREPSAVVAAVGRAHVGVASANYDAVAVIDVRTSAVVASYPLSFNVSAMAASPDGKRIYAGRAGDGGVDVSVIDTTAERVGTIYLAKGEDANIDALSVDPSGRRLYAGVSDARSSRLIVVDLETGRVRRSLELGASIRGLQIGMDSTAYVLTSDINDRGVLHVVDLVANRIMASAAVATAPMQLALSVDGMRAYVVDYDQVVVLSTETLAVIDTISVGARPSCVAVGVDRLYVADCAGGVTAYSVPAPAAMLYAPMVAANPLTSVEIRELEPAGV
ncbi:YncE family protein [Mycobacterium sp. URHB0044]|uniref:YncE family protein n=1 Tax=Mycobacterium sp. URHB0044 TaxID=1380386 RepID=UPI001E5BDB65|nr:YncE family protein [Mycobacterium sp. URHB0044]